VAEVVDAQVSKTCSFTGVPVRFRPPAPSLGYRADFETSSGMKTPIAAAGPSSIDQPEGDGSHRRP
jgi:hypothetical protein